MDEKREVMKEIRELYRDIQAAELMFPADLFDCLCDRPIDSQVDQLWSMISELKEEANLTDDEYNSCFWK